MEEVFENFPVTRDQIQNVLDFVVRSAKEPVETSTVP